MRPVTNLIIGQPPARSHALKPRSPFASSLARWVSRRSARKNRPFSHEPCPSCYRTHAAFVLQMGYS